jgi:hypothetical protein
VLDVAEEGGLAKFIALRRASSLNSMATDCAISGSFLKWNQAMFRPVASWTIKLTACSTMRHGRGKRPVISSGLRGGERLAVEHVAGENRTLSLRLAVAAHGAVSHDAAVPEHGEGRIERL